MLCRLPGRRGRRAAAQALPAAGLPPRRHSSGTRPGIPAASSAPSAAAWLQPESGGPSPAAPPAVRWGILRKRPPHRSSQPAARHTSSSVHTTSDRATLRVSCGDTPRLRREIGRIGHHKVEPAHRGQVLRAAGPPADTAAAPASRALGGAPGQTAGVLPQLQPGDGEGRLSCPAAAPPARPGSLSRRPVPHAAGRESPPTERYPWRGGTDRHPSKSP